MSDDLITPEELQQMVRRQALAKMLTGNPDSPMYGGGAPMPVGDGGANMGTPYAGAANAGGSLMGALRQRNFMNDVYGQLPPQPGQKFGVMDAPQLPAVDPTTGVMLPNQPPRPDFLQRGGKYLSGMFGSGGANG